MKLLISIIFFFLILAACNNHSPEEKGIDKDTMEVVPGYGAGHETGGSQSPSYPRPQIINEEQDTSRGIHGVNIDTTGAEERK